MNHSTTPYPFIFFGTSRFSVIALETLAKNGIVPSAIITTPDKPKGRKLILTAPETKIYGQEHNIPVYQFEKLVPEAVEEIRVLSQKLSIQWFLVASYGLIIPQSVLDIPSWGTINIHPSLLPAYRGATPLQQAILDDLANTGVTIMKMDAKMDHGPIILQEQRIHNPQNSSDYWPKKYIDLETELAKQSAELLAKHLADIIEGKIVPKEQDHDQATFTKKIQKENGLIDLSKLSGDEGRKAYLRFMAFHLWPTCFAFVVKNGKTIRIKITDARWNSETTSMQILKVIPEGQKEVGYEEFMKRI